MSWVRFDSRVEIEMSQGIAGFLALHAMVLQNVEDLSDDAPVEADPTPSAKGPKTPKAKAKGKPSKSEKSEKPEKSKPKCETKPAKETEKTPKRPPALKRPAARSEAGGSQLGESPLKRPAGNDKKVSIGKGYYKAQNKFGFKIDGKEKFSDPHLNSLVSRV